MFPCPVHAPNAEPVLAYIIDKDGGNAQIGPEWQTFEDQMLVGCVCVWGTGGRSWLAATSAALVSMAA